MFPHVIKVPQRVSHVNWSVVGRGADARIKLAKQLVLELHFGVQLVTVAISICKA